MFTVSDILAATGGTLVCGGETEVTGVSTDSRRVLAGELFVPLKGERFDGHDFIAEVAARGVGTVLAGADWLSANQLPAGLSCVAVNDTLAALGDLAAFHRRRFTLPMVGVTGSNGKTTTKEMLAAILSQTGPGLKTEGNLNNLIGLPQMLFRLTDEHCWAVLEMGMSEFGEIDRLAEIAAPSVGIITNAYPAHLATLGSVEGVARAKGELFLRLPEEGTAVFNADDPLIAACPVPQGGRRIGFGLHGATVTASDISGLGWEGQSFTLTLPDWSGRVELKAFGLHNVYNALAAAAAAWSMGIGGDLIVSGLASFRPYDKRFQLENLGRIILVDDSYNANPASMAAALLTLRELKGQGRVIAVLGDMLELGEETVAAHKDLGRLAATCADRLYLMGAMAKTVAAAAADAGVAGEEIVVATDHGAIVDDIRKDHMDGDCILVKGSRGMRMDLVAAALRSIYAGGAGEVN